MTEVLDNIRRIRESKGMSQTELAFRLDLEQSSYSQIESGNRKLSLERLLLIAEILETPVEKLLGSQAAAYQIPEPEDKTDEGHLPYGSSQVRLTMLEKEIEHLKKQLAAQEKIIKLLEEKCP